ncbi:hypothetical protein [Streptomyces sp. NPDC018031]|uniref:hypothetical protein n=1 Tax=Streptomyces sp. NPDC018031 TaxID=3365033 RepID=UPI00379BDEFC
MGLSRRSYLLIAALVLGLLGIAYATSRSGAHQGPDDATGPGDCARVRGPRPADDAPRLVLGSHGYATESPRGGAVRFTIEARLLPGARPLTLDAPFARGAVSVRFCAPRGGAVMAEATGLSPVSVQGVPAATPGGAIRLTRGQEAYLTVELPPSAIREGVTKEDLMASRPLRSNEAADYPVLVLTFADPHLKHPLVALSYEPDPGVEV